MLHRFRAVSSVAGFYCIALATLAGVGAPTASAIDILFDYTYDTTGFFTADRREAIERAADTYEVVLDDLDAIIPDFVNTWQADFFNPATGAIISAPNPEVPANTLLVYVGARNLGGTALANAGPGGWSASGTQSWIDTLWSRGEGTTADVFGDDAFEFGPWGGSIAFDTLASNGTPQNWHSGEGLPPGNSIDLYSVTAHELGHIFGFSSASSYANLVSAGTFTGPVASGLNGGQSVPLTSDNEHWAEGTTSPPGVASAPLALMNAEIPMGVRREFSALDFAALDDLGWQIDPSVFATNPADFDGDGDVDAADLNRWQTGYGIPSGATSFNGDANADGRVDGADLLVWQNNFGSAGFGSLTGTSIPEPSSLALALLVLLPCLRWRR